MIVMCVRCHEPFEIYPNADDYREGATQALADMVLRCASCRRKRRRRGEKVLAP